MVLHPGNEEEEFLATFTAHYFGEISDKDLGNYLESLSGQGLGNNVTFDATGKVVAIDGVTVEFGTFRQTGTTARIFHDGSESIKVGDLLNIIFFVGATGETREILPVTALFDPIAPSTQPSFTVTRAVSQAVEGDVASFYLEDATKTASYSQTDNVITITHDGSKTLEVEDTVDLRIATGSATTENLQVTEVISSTVFKVESDTSVSTTGTLNFIKQNKQNILSGNVDGIISTNVLSSKQSNSLIDVLSEGEIAGFHTPFDLGLKQGTDKYNIAALKDIFLNGTQILKNKADIDNLIEGDFNFKREDISFEPRFGTSNQTALTTINEIETETAVGIEVKKTTPVSRSISNQIDKLRITIVFPGLQKFNTETGKSDGTQVNLEILITENNGTEHRVIKGNSGSVFGKTNTQYFRDYMINNLSNLNYPITATVTRVTNDSTDTNLQNKFSWSSFTEITAEKRAYADIAHIGLKFNAESFRSIPTRTFRVYGIKVKIPHNATVREDGSLSFSGSFNGTLKTDKEWTSDPAWVLYDVLTNTRYGASISETNIDKFAFYSASEYNSEQVDDGSGTGSTEPRFSINVNINNQMEAFTLIQNICSVMRVQAFYEAGSITISQDRPSDPVYTFNISNVTEGGFSYSNQSQKAKFTKINVGFFDMTTQAIDYETVDDTTAQSRYGIKTQTIKAFGTTSRGQASRMAKWLLFNQNNSSEIVNFNITAEAGVLVRPGQIISIADEVKQGVRRGGRIKTGISTTQIEVDDTASTDLVTSNTAKLSVILSDGTLETKEISGISGATVTVSSAFSSVPQANSVWVIENTTLEPTTWRVVNVQEKENLTFSITAASHNSGKYAFIEDGTALPVKNFSVITKKLSAPTNLTATEEIIVINNKAVSRLTIQFASVKGAIGYYLQHNFNNGNFVNQQIKSTEFSIDNISNGKFVIRVFSVNILNKLSDAPNELTFNAIGKTELPEDPTNLTVEPVSDQFIRLRFTPAKAKDVIHGGAVQVRHTPSTGALATFANSTDIIPQLAGNISETLVPALTGTYSIKFVDDGGRRSQNAAKIIVTQPDPQPHQVILTQREDTTDPKFQGEKTRTIFNSDLDGLVLDGSIFFDNISSVDILSSFDFLTGDIFPLGFYDFQNIVDLGAIFNLTLKRRFVTSANIVNDLFDSRLNLIDNMQDFDGAAAENCNAKLLVSTSQGNPAISTAATYSQSQNLITLNASSHGASVGDNFRVDFTSGTADDGFLKVTSVTNSNVCVLEAKRKFAKYTSIGRALRLFTDGDHGGLSEGNYSAGQGAKGDTVKIVFLTGELVGRDTDFKVQLQLPLGIVQLQIVDSVINQLSPENSQLPSGTGLLEFIKIKDTSDNNVTTSGNCNISSPFSAFNTFANGEYIARGYKFQVEMTSSDPDETINVTELGFEASVKRRTETVNTAIASNCGTSGSAKTVTFQHPFFTGTGSLGGSTSAFLPSIGITLEGAASGDFFNITSVTGTQFVIETRSSSGLKDLSFKYTAIGFGKGG